MKLRKLLFSIAIGISIALCFHRIITIGDIAYAQAVSEPTCLSTHRYAVAGGSENLVHLYEGTEKGYWLYHTYGRADTEQQYPMELIAITEEEGCSVEFWNAPNHDFSYADHVPLDVAKQFALAELKLFRETIGDEAFRGHYSTVDRSNFDEETLWALEQLNF